MVLWETLKLQENLKIEFINSLLPILPSRYKNLVKVLESWKKSAAESSIDLVIVSQILRMQSKHFNWAKKKSFSAVRGNPKLLNSSCMYRLSTYCRDKYVSFIKVFLPLRQILRTFVCLEINLAFYQCQWKAIKPNNRPTDT